MRLSPRCRFGGGVPVPYGVPAPCRFRLASTLHKPSAPIPPAPFPAGEGGAFCYLLQGASPLATLRLYRERHCVPDSLRYPKTHAGSGTGSRYLPGYRRRRPFRYKKVSASFREGAAKERGTGGDGTIRRYATAAFEMVPSPGAGQRYATGAGVRKSFPPPSPRPALEERSSHAGEGGDFCYLLQGASPLASPRLRRGRHWFEVASPTPGGCFSRRYRRAGRFPLPSGTPGGVAPFAANKFPSGKESNAA